jgi:hypothetical protein
MQKEEKEFFCVFVFVVLCGLLLFLLHNTIIQYLATLQSDNSK